LTELFWQKMHVVGISWQ